MAENLMNSAHKAGNDKFREGWERTFRSKRIALALAWYGRKYEMVS